MIVEPDDITVVVQGSLTSSKEKEPRAFVKKSLSSIRQVLPSAKIILSTWEGENAQGLDYDILILNADPKPAVYETKYNMVKRYCNVNRQIESTLSGLKKAKTTYALKMRTDSTLISDAFIMLFQTFQSRSEKVRILDARVVSTSWFSRNPNTFLSLPYHPSDLFFFGKTTDLLKIWDVPLASDEMLFYFDHHQNTFGKKKPFQYSYQYAPEQYIWISFLKKYHFDVDCNGYADLNENNKVLSELSIVNNLFLAHPRKIGFKSLKHSINLSNMDSITTVYGDKEYLGLYKKYCCGDLVIPYMKPYVFCLFFLRLAGYFLFEIKAFLKKYVSWVPILYLKFRK